MQGKLAVITAAASGLILMSAVAAGAAPSVNFKGSLGSGSLVELAREGGGGRGGGWGGGGGMKSGGGGLKSGGGGMKSGGGGGGRAYSGRSYGGGDGWKGRSGGGDFKGRSSGRYAGKAWDGGDLKRGGSKRWDGDKRRHASRDHDVRKFQRHRVWRNGAWVWIYGPDIYAYGDNCGWLWQRAQATGSPYWWSRYEACVGYY